MSSVTIAMRQRRPKQNRPRPRKQKKIPPINKSEHAPQQQSMSPVNRLRERRSGGGGGGGGERQIDVPD
jgi:hypothetical protein